ncbi:MAG: SDR family oxidoreductase [Solirubrobacteraceae bacterium]
MITGALSGIGRATALRFGTLGSRVLLCDLSPDKASGLVAEIRNHGGEAQVVALDVRDPLAQQAAADTAVRLWGRLDVLVANAGIGDQSFVHDGDPGRWTAVVETNLLGTIFSARAALPIMFEQGAGHIFVLASISGRETYPGEPVYIASKWGQVGFAHSLREEVAPRGIRVTIVEPGLVDTPLARRSPAVRRLLEEIEPLAPENIADAILYAFRQSAEVVVSELAIRPLRQGRLTF